MFEALIVTILIFGDSLSATPTAYYPLSDEQPLEGVDLRILKGDATIPGANSSNLLDPAFAPYWCGGMSPVQCELQRQIPGDVYSLIAIGANTREDCVIFGCYRQDLVTMIEMADFYGVKPILSTVPYNIYISETVDDINAQIYQLAAEYNLPVIDYYTAMANQIPHCLSEDDVHIRVECYEVWNQVTVDALRQIVYQ